MMESSNGANSVIVYGKGGAIAGQATLPQYRIYCGGAPCTPCVPTAPHGPRALPAESHPTVGHREEHAAAGGVGEQSVLLVEQLRLGKGRLAPLLTTVPMARTGPVSTVIGRRNFTVRSSEVYAVPCGRVDWTAQPAAESSRVAKMPPWTLPIGL